MNKFISIIVPIFNGQYFLNETIQTVINQSYTNWELLLIDDGSTDHSKRICLNHSQKDDRIHYYYKKNGGQASARNLGITNSKGEWVAMLDADDLWHKDKLLKQVEAITSYPDISICFTNTLAFQKSLDNELYNANNKKYGLLDATLFREIYTSNYISNSSVILKKQVLLKIGLYNESESLRGSEDWELLLRMLFNKEKAYGIKEKLLYYRVHEGGIHLQNARMFIGKTLVYKVFHKEQSISKLLKLKQYRYTYRELLNHLSTEGRNNEILNFASEIWRLDPLSFVTLKQKIIFKIFNIKSALWISNNIIYRIGYRIEKFNYKLFLNE